MKRKVEQGLLSAFCALLILISISYPAIGIPILIAVIASVIIWHELKYNKIRVETLQQLTALTPIQFERAIATLLMDLGYKNVRITGGPRDLCRDIACEDIWGRRVMVQCKKYTNKKVGSSDLQKFIGMMREHEASKGIYITTSEFTEPAKRLAKKYNIELWDGAKLSTLLIEQKKKLSERGGQNERLWRQNPQSQPNHWTNH